jgi:phosphatidate cytidylyltransferase
MIRSNFIKRFLSSIALIIILYFVLNSNSSLFFIFFILTLIISIIELKNISSGFFFVIGILFILFSFFTIFQIKIVNIEIFYLLLIIVIGTDIGGYLFGKIIGGPKLTKISPSKTFSGVAGSLIMSQVFTFIYIKSYQNSLTDFNYDNYSTVIKILILSIVSQFGDLTISYFKRLSNVKDTGKIIPGHGGLLDRIDGLIFIFPFYYLIFFIQ